MGGEYCVLDEYNSALTESTDNSRSSRMCTKIIMGIARPLGTRQRAPYAPLGRTWLRRRHTSIPMQVLTIGVAF